MTITEDKLGEVPFGQLVPHPDNIRDELKDIDSLANSIAESGLMQALRVRAEDDGTFTILAGHRRHAALTQLGTGDDIAIPAMITTDNGETDAVTMLVENIQRDDVNIMEEAAGIGMLLRHGLNQKTIAKRTGLSPSVVSERALLAKLPAFLRTFVVNGDLRVNTAVDFVRAYKKIPAEVHAAFEEKVGEGNVDFNFDWEVRRFTIAGVRQSLIAEGIKQAEAAGHEVFASESDVLVPEGKVVDSSVARKPLSDIKATQKKLIVSVGTDGESILFRPVKFINEENASSSSLSDQEKEQRKQMREWKVAEREFWQDVLSQRHKKGDVLYALALVAVAEQSLASAKIACKLMEFEEPEGSDYDWAAKAVRAGVEDGDTKWMIAAAAASYLQNSSFNHQPEGLKAVRDFFG